MNLFKKLIIFCFCFLVGFYNSFLWGQCPSGNITLTSQLEVDNFAANYPSCTEITDTLRIGVSSITSDIADLSNLPPIESIGGNLEISRNYYLTDLSGLENLTSIGGDLSIYNNANLTNLSSLGNLISTSGYLSIWSNGSLTDLSGLENLTSTDGLTIWNNDYLTDLSGLENLTSIGRDMTIYSNSNLIDLSGLENLTSIGGDMTIETNLNLIDLSSLESLISIGGDMRVQDNKDLTNLGGLENLISISGYLLIGKNDYLIDISGLENLISIGGYLWIYDNGDLTDISGLGNLTSIGGYLLIDNNTYLTDLSGLGNLTSIGDFLLIDDNYSLTDISGLENLTLIDELRIFGNNSLTDISGLGNLTSIGSYLWIQDNSDLTDISGLGNLTSIGGYLWINDNDNLTDLSGLGNLTSIGGDLNIYDNFNLTDISLGSLTSIGGDLDIELNYNLISLSGLGNLDSIGGDLNIYQNGTLSICDISVICDYLHNGGISVISANASGCLSANEILNLCSLSRVYAEAFYDLNQNGTKETNEPNYYDVSISIMPGDNSFYMQNTGMIYIEPGTYTAAFDEISNPNWELTSMPSSYTFSLNEGDTETITFGIYPTQQISHIQTTINSAPARCNERITLDVTTKNIGTTVASGTMWLTIDDAIPDFTFIHQPDTIIEGGVNYYGWHFTDLYPGQTIIKNVEVTVPGPPDFELGEQLLFVSFSEFTDINGEDGSEGFRYNPEVLCSYDPNDKLVNPNREGDYVLFEEDFIYTIRFQNTGNDVAYDVVIRDTLDANLDLSTFRLLGSSHANRLNTILSEDEGTLTFEFRDIFLPDSTTNFEASQGYVNYLISPFDGLAEETPITNSAGIYFDLNPPIITNTTQSIMVSELPTVSVENPDNSFDFNILPNPNTGTFTIQNIPTGTYQIHNTSGQIIQQGNMQNDLLIDISREAQGVYFISVTVDDATSVRRIVKM